MRPQIVNLSRRGFLGTSAATGLVLGVSACSQEQAAEDSGAVYSESELDAYITVGSDNVVTLTTPAAEMGQGIYTALPKIIAEEMDCDWQAVQVRLSHADAVFGMSTKRGRQSTGNSDSIMGYYNELREVGAVARTMLAEAGAARLNADVDELIIEDGIISTPDGDSLTFGDVAADAALLEAPLEVALKDPASFKLLGKPDERKDTPAKVDGSAVFGTDVHMDGMLHAALRTSPTFGGSVSSFDAASVEGRSGVQGVAEVPAGVAVVADTFWQAKTAADELDVSFDKGEFAGTSTDDLFADLRTLVEDDDQAVEYRANGDSAAALAASDKTFEATYEVPYLAHATMEPQACTALVTDEGCTVWAPSQNATGGHQLAADMTGLPLEQVRYNRTFLGGGFGRKWELDFVRQAVGLAIEFKGRPVKVTWTREEDTQHDFYRPGYVARFRGGLDEDGRLSALEARVAGQSILRYQQRPLPPKFADPTSAGALIQPAYGIANERVDAVEYDAPIPVGFWRAVAASHGGFMGETAIDEAAALAGRDPYTFRREMLSRDDRLVKVLDTVAEKADWGKTMPEGWGQGIAFTSAFGSLSAQVADVEVVGDEIKVHKITCAFDCGQTIEPRNAEAQMESGILFGLTATLFGDLSFEDGAVVESNFNDYRMVTLKETPEIDVTLIDSGAAMGGAGEVSQPATAPAVGGAIYAATGRRLRSMPLTKHGLFAV